MGYDAFEHHTCADQAAMDDESHIAKMFYGDAFHDIQYEPKSRMWFAHNREYATAIRFCPWCGMQLLAKPLTENTK